MHFHVSVPLALAALLAPFGQSEIEAAFKFTNKTSRPLYVAFVRHLPGCEGGVPWEKRGWWRLEPGQTKTVQGGSITNRYSYYYAESEDRGWVWTSAGPTTCLPQPAFTWCWNTCNNSPTTRILGLRRIDSGDSSDHTVNLNPPAQSPRPASGSSEDAVENRERPSARSEIQIPTDRNVADASSSDEVGSDGGAATGETSETVADPMSGARAVTSVDPMSAENVHSPIDPMSGGELSPSSPTKPDGRPKAMPVGAPGDPMSGETPSSPSPPSEGTPVENPGDPMSGGEALSSPSAKSKGQPKVMPASPHPVVARQPDGTIIALRIHGAEKLNWQTDLNGYPVVRTSDGRYCYATVDAKGHLKATDRIVGKADPAAAGIKKDRPTDPATPVTGGAAATTDPMGDATDPMSDPSSGKPTPAKQSEERLPLPRETTR